MKDQMETKVLTNSFTFSHSSTLLVSFALVFAIGCSFWISSVWQFALLLAGLSTVAFLSWTHGQVSGVIAGAESALEYLVEDGFLEREVLEDDVEVSRIENLVYLDKCECGERLIINPSATKGHRENGKEQDDDE